jgi:Aldo/keto reductase family
MPYASQTSTVILGASNPEQLKENLKALEVLPKLTPEVLQRIEEIVGTAPKAEVRVLDFRFFGGVDRDIDVSFFCAPCRLSFARSCETTWR